MKQELVKNKIKKLPDGPGVYQFLHGKKVLYVGKATSLRDRVRSYFSGNMAETRGPLIEKMLREFDDIKFQKTDSVLEALILEANLIKKLKPEANIKEKDDRSFNYVVITDEKFPRVLVVRGKELEENNSPPSPSLNLREGASETLDYKNKKWGRVRIFGPFPNGLQLKEALKIIRKMFPFRDRCEVGKGKPCFNYQIGLCPGVCIGKISEKEYKKTIKNIILFFESDKKRLIKNLEKQMSDFAKAREFEKAQKIKKTIFTLNHIHDISLIKEEVSRFNLDTNFRIESYDIAHLSGTNMVGAMAVLENGEAKKSDYRKFHIKGQVDTNDIKALAEILTRRLNHHEWQYPNLIVIDGGKAQLNAVVKILKKLNLKIPTVSVVKDEKHRPREILETNYDKQNQIINYGKEKIKIKYEKEILLANAEAHRFAISFHRKLRGKMQNG